MLVQLFRDNYDTTPTENLITSIYDGFFDGVENWFTTATLLNTDLRTSNLTSLNTTTLNLFNSSQTQSCKVAGFFRAKKTGTYRFYTYSNDKNILEIDGDDIIVNNNLNQISFANKSLIAGRYYSFNLYYGSRVLKYPPVAFPSSTNTTVNTLTVGGQLFGNGLYTARTSGTSSGYPYNVVDKNVLTRWRSNNNYPNTTTTTITNYGNIVGEWFQLQLPNSIVLDKFYLRTRDSSTSIRPRGIVMLGSNTGLNDWNVLYLSNDINFVGMFENTFSIDVEPQSYSYFRFIATSTYGGNYYEIWELELYEKPSLECGYMEPNDDGTSSGSTNPDDFITNATGLTTYYDINPETQNVLTTADYPLVIEDDSLQGLFRISIIAFYNNRANFTTGKHSILYLASDDLFNNFNGTYKNYIQIHEKPVANDNERKRFTQFSDDMSFECELNGRIEVNLRRGVNEPTAFRYAMLILDVERIPVKNL